MTYCKEIHKDRIICQPNVDCWWLAILIIQDKPDLLRPRKFVKKRTTRRERQGKETGNMYWEKLILQKWMKSWLVIIEKIPTKNNWKATLTQCGKLNLIWNRYLGVPSLGKNPSLERLFVKTTIFFIFSISQEELGLSFILIWSLPTQVELVHKALNYLQYLSNHNLKDYGPQDEWRLWEILVLQK